MKNRIHFIDMRFSDSGHYLDDLKEFSFTSEQYCCAYYAPCGAEKELPVNFKSFTNKKGWGFYFLILRILLLYRRDNIVFLSCSYVPLFLLSLLSLNFNYVFRIHSMPTIRTQLYKKIIWLISKLSRRTVFLDYPVRDYFINQGLTDENKSVCVIGRTISTSVKIKRKKDSNYKLLFIGAMNSEKNLLPVITGLCRKKIDGLSVSFLSKGIEQYDNELVKLLDMYPDTKIDNCFLPREEFDKAINEADALILPYKKTYGVRFSAVLNDALRQGKKVLTIRLPQFEYYAKMYNACYLYDDAEDLPRAVAELMNSQPLELEKLNLDYSEEVKVNQFFRVYV